MPLTTREHWSCTSWELSETSLFPTESRTSEYKSYRDVSSDTVQFLGISIAREIEIAQSLQPKLWGKKIIIWQAKPHLAAAADPRSNSGPVGFLAISVLCLLGPSQQHFWLDFFSLYAKPESMCTSDKQQAHSRSYEGSDLAQHKTQALFAPTSCNCTSARAYLQTSGHRLLLGPQPSQPLSSPAVLLLSLSGLLQVWIPCWEGAAFAAGAPGSISHPALGRTRPGARAFLLKRWTNIIWGLSLLVQLWCLFNKWERWKLFSAATLTAAVVTAIAFHIPRKPHPVWFLGKDSRGWVCSDCKL